MHDIASAIELLSILGLFKKIDACFFDKVVPGGLGDEVASSQADTPRHFNANFLITINPAIGEVWPVP